MGEPNSDQIGLVMQVALGALGPNGKVPARTLRDTGLHREIVRRHMAALSPEIKYLVGWKPLEEYDYPKSWYDSTIEDMKLGKKLTGKWYEALEAQGLSFEKAVMIYDGEQERPPAPDYRLFILRDGRLLYYNGGFHGSRRPSLVCGEPMSVLDYLDQAHPGSDYSEPSVVMPFVILLKALEKAFGSAIRDRESKVNHQKALQASLQRAIHQIADK